MSTDQPLVTVATFATAGEAEIARIMLEGHGVPCYLADAELVNMMWLASNAVGGIKLQVAANDVARAEQLLTRRQPSRRHRPVDDYGLEDPQRPAQPAEDEPGPAAVGDSADMLVIRALRAALLGLVCCPLLLHLWSLLLLTEAVTRNTPVSAEHRGKMLAALMIDVAVLALVAALVLWWSLQVRSLSDRLL